MYTYEHAFGVANVTSKGGVESVNLSLLHSLAPQNDPFVDGYPQSTHKLSTKSIHKVKSIVFSHYFDFVDTWSLEIRNIRFPDENLLIRAIYPQSQSNVKTRYF